MSTRWKHGREFDSPEGTEPQISFLKMVKNAKCFPGITFGQAHTKETQDQVQKSTYQSKYQHYYISSLHKTEDNDLEFLILSKN